MSNAPRNLLVPNTLVHSLCSFSCSPITNVHLPPSCRLVPLARRCSSAYLSSPAPLIDCDISDPFWLSGQSKNTTSVYYKNKYMQQAGYIFNADGWNEYNREKTNTDTSDQYEKLEDEPTLDNTMVLMKWRKSERCPRRSLDASLPATVVGSIAQRVPITARHRTLCSPQTITVIIPVTLAILAILIIIVTIVTPTSFSLEQKCIYLRFRALVTIHHRLEAGQQRRF